MLERKPGLYKEPTYFSYQLEARIALWTSIVNNKDRSYSMRAVVAANLSKESAAVLHQLYLSEDEDKTSILEKILPDAAMCIAMANEMATVFNAEDRIAILKRFLENGLQIKPEDTILLLSIDNSQDFPEVIKFFFDHELCTTEHILFFMTNYFNDLDFFKLCITHPKFPATREEYHSYKGRRVEDLYNAYNIPEKFLSNLELIFLQRPQLMILSDLNIINNILVYLQSQKIDCKKLIENVWLLVWAHPDASYLSDRNASAKVFYFAAQYGYNELFKCIYFNDDTTEEARKSAMQVAIQHKRWNLIENVSRPLSVSHYQKIILPFYVTMIYNPFPKEVLVLIFNMLIEQAQLDCVVTAKRDNALPEIYRNQNNFELALFQKNVVTQDSLINRAIVGIENYFKDQPKPKSGSKGKIRGEVVVAILKNVKISTECKFTAIYAVLNEETYYESRVKAHLQKSIGQYLKMINVTAECYADKLNLDLTKLCNNFMNFVHCGLIDKARSIDEKQLLKYITRNAEVGNTKTI